MNAGDVTNPPEPDVVLSCPIHPSTPSVQICPRDPRYLGPTHGHHGDSRATGTFLGLQIAGQKGGNAIYTYMYVCMYVYINICIYIYILCMLISIGSPFGGYHSRVGGAPHFIFQLKAVWVRLSGLTKENQMDTSQVGSCWKLFRKDTLNRPGISPANMYEF